MLIDLLSISILQFTALPETAIAGPNIVLNTIAAEILGQFADKLEQTADFKTGLSQLVKTAIKEHKQIIFNGNNYADEWAAEAEKRGLQTSKPLPRRCRSLSCKKISICSKNTRFLRAVLMVRFSILFAYG